MDESAAQLSDLSKYVGNVLLAMIPLIGIISFIMILVGGFTFLTGAGNPESMKKGKGVLGGAIAGLALAIVSWLVLLLIEKLTGAKVTQFKLGL